MPAVGLTSPSVTRSVVVFPDPFGPSSPVTWPAGARNDTSRTAVTGPNVLVSPRTSSSIAVHLPPA